jgi:riboflavin synthase
MFTGIIEHLGILEELAVSETGGRVKIHAPSLSGPLAVSRSIAVNGCCLTITEVDGSRFSADLSGETLNKTSFGTVSGGLRNGAHVNLEQPLTAGKEFGGHFVLGHVDDVGRVIELREESSGNHSWALGVEVPLQFAKYVVPKGSVTIDGISLTVARWDHRILEVAVIPYTYAHTNLKSKTVGHAVNLEGDVLGKYIESYLEARENRIAE